MISRFELHVPPDSATPRAVRRVFASRFGDHPALQDLLLCLSEVLTNAVLHAATPIVITAGANNERVRVEVRDGSLVEPTLRSPGTTTPTGRGLRLLDSLCSSWGVDVVAEGKTVWFEIRDEQPA